MPDFQPPWAVLPEAPPVLPDWPSEPVSLWSPWLPPDGVCDVSPWPAAGVSDSVAPVPVDPCRPADSCAASAAAFAAA